MFCLPANSTRVSVQPLLINLIKIQFPSESLIRNHHWHGWLKSQKKLFGIRMNVAIIHNQLYNSSRHILLLLSYSRSCPESEPAESVLNCNFQWFMQLQCTSLRRLCMLKLQYVAIANFESALDEDKLLQMFAGSVEFNWSIFRGKTKLITSNPPQKRNYLGFRIQ